MKEGTPLTDMDRLPWLLNLHDVIERWTTENVNGILACSALREDYRRILRSGASEEDRSRLGDSFDRRLPRSERCLDANLQFILLDGTEEILAERMRLRRGHFMNPALLRSQLATLESPRPEENVLVVDVSQPVDDIVEIIENRLFLRMHTDARST